MRLELADGAPLGVAEELHQLDHLPHTANQRWGWWSRDQMACSHWSPSARSPRPAASAPPRGRQPRRSPCPLPSGRSSAHAEYFSNWLIPSLITTYFIIIRQVELLHDLHKICVELRAGSLEAVKLKLEGWHHVHCELDIIGPLHFEDQRGATHSSRHSEFINPFILHFTSKAARIEASYDIFSNL